MGRPVHFEIHAEDPERAAGFYRRVLGWRVDQWGDQPYWLVVTGPDDRPGINGGLLPRRGAAPGTGQPVNGFVLTTEVDDLDATLERATAAGATSALDKELMPGVGWLAYIHDPDGNLLGLLQPEPETGQGADHPAEHHTGQGANQPAEHPTGTQERTVADATPT